MFPPGHFYSPLLDIESLVPGKRALPHDGAEDWEHVNLQPESQQALYHELLDLHPLPNFPAHASDGFRYHHDNGWFPLPDAAVLSGLMRREKPARIVEVGAGFSTAVMLDTLDHSGGKTQITCLEPQPERLRTLLSQADMQRLHLVRRPVQEVDSGLFDTLQAGDFLFIDSSHVAKVGSDVSFLFLRVLPRLRPGVWVHVHDVFYPESYPAEWVREGRAWNESLMLRAFLIGNAGYEVRAFNNFASSTLPASLWEHCPAFLSQCGSSFWMQRR